MTLYGISDALDEQQTISHPSRMTIHVCRCDLTKDEDLNTLVASVNLLRPIRGIIHTHTSLNFAMTPALHRQRSDMNPLSITSTWAMLLTLNRFCQQHEIETFAVVLPLKGMFECSVECTLAESFVRWQTQRGLPSVSVFLPSHEGDDEAYVKTLKRITKLVFLGGTVSPSNLPVMDMAIVPRIFDKRMQPSPLFKGMFIPRYSVSRTSSAQPSTHPLPTDGTTLTSTGAGDTVRCPELDDQQLVPLSHRQERLWRLISTSQRTRLSAQSFTYCAWLPVCMHVTQLAKALRELSTETRFKSLRSMLVRSVQKGGTSSSLMGSPLNASEGRPSQLSQLLCEVADVNIDFAFANTREQVHQIIHSSANWCSDAVDNASQLFKATLIRYMDGPEEKCVVVISGSSLIADEQSIVLLMQSLVIVSHTDTESAANTSDVSFLSFSAWEALSTNQGSLENLHLNTAADQPVIIDLTSCALNFRKIGVSSQVSARRFGKICWNPSSQITSILQTMFAGSGIDLSVLALTVVSAMMMRAKASPTVCIGLFFEDRPYKFVKRTFGPFATAMSVPIITASTESQNLTLEQLYQTVFAAVERSKHHAHEPSSTNFNFEVAVRCVGIPSPNSSIVVEPAQLECSDLGVDLVITLYHSLVDTDSPFTRFDITYRSGVYTPSFIHDRFIPDLQDILLRLCIMPTATVVDSLHIRCLQLAESSSGHFADQRICLEVFQRYQSARRDETLEWILLREKPGIKDCVVYVCKDDIYTVSIAFVVVFPESAQKHPVISSTELSSASIVDCAIPLSRIPFSADGEINLSLLKQSARSALDLLSSSLDSLSSSTDMKWQLTEISSLSRESVGEYLERFDQQLSHLPEPMARLMAQQKQTRFDYNVYKVEVTKGIARKALELSMHRGIWIRKQLSCERQLARTLVSSTTSSKHDPTQSVPDVVIVLQVGRRTESALWQELKPLKVQVIMCVCGDRFFDGSGQGDDDSERSSHAVTRLDVMNPAHFMELLRKTATARHVTIIHTLAYELSSRSTHPGRLDDNTILQQKMICSLLGVTQALQSIFSEPSNLQQKTFFRILCVSRNAISVSDHDSVEPWKGAVTGLLRSFASTVDNRCSCRCIDLSEANPQVFAAVVVKELLHACDEFGTERIEFHVLFCLIV
jgi:hypothetical protein